MMIEVESTPLISGDEHGSFPTFSASAKSDPELQMCLLSGEKGLALWNHDSMEPFLMHVASDADHWLYLSSHGAIAAGRRNPDYGLFPYLTQDRLFDLRRENGGCTLLRIERAGEAQVFWEPFAFPCPKDRRESHVLRKSLAGTRVEFESSRDDLGLICRCEWTVSRRYGFQRRVTLKNSGNTPLKVEILDGLVNVQPPGLGEQFQSRFSILGDAYKRNELILPEGLGLFYLNSVPTDLAEPSEGLRASVAWVEGLEVAHYLLSPDQISRFREGLAVSTEKETRGRRGAFLAHANLELRANAEHYWTVVADIDWSAARIVSLREELKSAEYLGAALEQNAASSSRNLRQLIASCDGLQQTADERRCARHFSNTLNNAMRGGVFLHGNSVPMRDFCASLRAANRLLWEKHREVLEKLPELCALVELREVVDQQQDPQLARHCWQYMPLVFSRRHGDPSRPWNRFNIELYDADGNPRFAYQGNWRDIFQNWEALTKSHPMFIAHAINRFFNATTGDGYNPYRITKDSFDWEKIEPDDPWANIGYWGDHQIIYLLKLLEQMQAFFPAELRARLTDRSCAYARIPYRLKDFASILADPHHSVDYDHAEEAAIEKCVAEGGFDGQLHRTPDGQVHLACMAEKLIVPLLAKLCNLVPGGGIWMNTQRPEWNDANNALAGYGLSVVTLAYLHRYLIFLEELFGAAPEARFSISSEVVEWLEETAGVLSALRLLAPAEMTAGQRFQQVQALGLAFQNYRHVLYNNGFSGQMRQLSGVDLLGFLADARCAVRSSLEVNVRADGLFHSYNILEQPTAEELSIGHLEEMLEGQVAALSARLLSCTEAVQMLDALQRSRLYSPRHDSFLLYPDRPLPGFLEKNVIDPESARQIPALARMLENGDARLIEQDVCGNVHFNGAFRHAGLLDKAIPGNVPLSERKAILQLYEKTFNHRAFTGRSTSFFAYEGLGSVYWHMVSKLILAIQENLLTAPGAAQNNDDSGTMALLAHYRACLRGLGVDKAPADYGAFPTDPYSHTPAEKGAQQPGMTGQVKEDFLVRLNELGISVTNGRLLIEPKLLRRQEFVSKPHSFLYFDVTGQERTLKCPPNSLAFTFCQVPFLYCLENSAQVLVHKKDQSCLSMPTLALDLSSSQALFERDPNLRFIEVHLSPQDLAPDIS